MNKSDRVTGERFTGDRVTGERFAVDRFAVERFEVAPDYSIARIINGGWQLSHGHQGHSEDPKAVVDGLLKSVEAGFTTFDGADIYGGVEELFGRLLKVHRASSVGGEIQVHTKCVPDLDDLATLRRPAVESIIDRSLRRLGVERLDLVQFHWWDYQVPGYVDAAGWLHEMQQKGKIRHLGGTNFDTQRLRELLDAGIPLIAHQVQYSLLDPRPERQMVDLCAQRGVTLLCYGSLAGGFLSRRYRGAAELPLDQAGYLANRSLTKYRLIIEEMGGWGLYQELLRALAEVAARYGVSLANVAVRWLLDRPQVGAAIVGTRRGAHRESNQRALNLRLDAADRRLIDAVLTKRQGPGGSVFGLERVVDGAHQRIMKTGLNSES